MALCAKGPPQGCFNISDANNGDPHNPSSLAAAAGKPPSLFRFAVALNMGAPVSSVQSMISMTSIDHANLARLALTLLVAFDALLIERSVTRAAARIGLGQSAMSHNLARLRT